MTWTAPDVVRIDEPFVGDERTMLDGWLEWQRSTVLWKCAGLTGEQLAARPTRSTLSLLGIVRHMADVERTWFRRRFRGEAIGRVYSDDAHPEACFDDLDPVLASEDFARLQEEMRLARLAVAGASLEDTFVSERWGEMSLRWIYIHMIEEYARHNGHADLLREHIDGRTGA